VVDVVEVDVVEVDVVVEVGGGTGCVDVAFMATTSEVASEPVSATESVRSTQAIPPSTPRPPNAARYDRRRRLEGSAEVTV